MAHSSIVVMGVSGSGKSTVGALLATRLGLPFIDGDDLHPLANKQKMAAGHPLGDADRVPWLDAIAAALAHAPVVIACSALKRRYRDRLRESAPDVQFIYLAGTPTHLAQRLSARSHDFMPPGLLASQLAILEPPGSDENALTIDIRLSPDAIVDYATRWLNTSKHVHG
jgi:carbohydrate kinase (thermoresistant glucokinase family)